MGLGFKPLDIFKTEKKKREDIQKEIEKYFREGRPSYYPSNYREIHGILTDTFSNVVRKYPREYSSAYDAVTRTDMLNRGIYVPSTMERSMLFALGFITFIGLGMFVWKTTK